MTTQQEFICEISSSSKNVYSTSPVLTDLELSHRKQFQMQLDLFEEKKMTLQEQRDSLFQQNANLQLAVKEMSEQMSVFKNRKAGVETVALLLRESKVENIRMTKRCQVMETAITNLQNRLSSNGLSSSVDIEESEVFVPGASKQTLDNLAKENARLRGQIRNSENINSKKQFEDVQSMRTTLEIAETEISQLKKQLVEMEDSKAEMIHQYKMELKSQSDSSTPSNKTALKQTQTELGHSNVDNLKALLSQVSIDCQNFKKQLEKTQEEQSYDHSTTDEKFAQMTKSYEQVCMMNQGLQSHLGQKEQEVQFLHNELVELEGRMKEMTNPEQLISLKKEIVMLRDKLHRKEADNVQLKKEIGVLREEMATLSQKFMAKRSQPQFDASIVEILKQQIQVCTEDFNTERRDREQAVNKIKQLQEQNNRFIAEIATLKFQMDTLKKENMALMQQIQSSHLIKQDNRHINSPPFLARGLQTPSRVSHPPHMMRPQGSLSSGNSSLSTSSSSYNYHNQTPVSADLNTSTVGQNVGNMSVSRVQQSMPQGDFLMLPMKADNEFASLPRTLGSVDTERLIETRPGLVSMPPPAQSSKDKGEYYTCPKCNKEFRDSQGEDLLAHINVCTD